ncbi:MAG: hypothetical protein RI932_117 [Pseudomonadota bacterium]|jgi:hypothetical protein
MTLTVSMLLSCGSAWADAGLQKPSPVSQGLRFALTGSQFPSYDVFKDVFIAEMFQAKKRICILSTRFEDRELAFVLLNASRRSVSTHVRVEPQRTSTRVGVGRLGRVVDDLRSLGLTVLEQSLSKLNLPEPTLVALDNRAWNVSQGLSEVVARPVDVEAAPFTAAEVCSWAEAASSAKAATRR